MNLSDFSTEVKQLLVEARAQRTRLSEREKIMRRVAEYAGHLDRAIDKLRELDEKEGGE